MLEDDEELARRFAAGRRDGQIAFDVALDSTAGLARAQVTDYDVIVLDRDLPVVHALPDTRPRRTLKGFSRSD